MGKATWDKLAAAGGIVGVVLFVVAGAIYGSPPTVDDDAQSVASFFSDNRDSVLTVTFLQGLGVLALIWFVAALVTTMRDEGEPRLATAALAAFAIVFAVGSVSALVRATLAYSVADEGADLILPLYHLSVVFDVFANLLGAGFFLAVGGAAIRTGFIARWWGWVSVVAGIVQIIGATAWARDGFWSPTGGAAFVCFIVFLVWMLVTSVLLTMKASRAGAAATA